jgi:hypothetical protein
MLSTVNIAAFDESFGNSMLAKSKEVNAKREVTEGEAQSLVEGQASARHTSHPRGIYLEDMCVSVALDGVGNIPERTNDAHESLDW